MSATTGEAGARPRVLVVDDDKSVRESLRRSLEFNGYDVALATDGAEALAGIGAADPDVVIMDVMMPRLDGIEATRALRSARNDVPILVLTARDAVGDRVEGLDAGADDYIPKPINFAELEARVNSLLRIKALQVALAAREVELSELNDKLRQISLTDGLTQIENRRSLEMHLHEMWQHSLRLHEPIALIICDIDKFKAVNDNYGHQAGDSVLKEFAQLLKSEAREIDRVGRYGGEEFLLILSGTVLDAAVTFAERLREKVEGHTFTYDGGTLRRTMSCGVAASPHPKVKDQEALLRAADNALYVAKETGRNRVIRFDSADFNAHTQSKGNDSTDGNKPGKETAAGGGGNTPGSPPRVTATAEGAATRT